MKNLELEPKAGAYRQIESKFCEINLQALEIVKMWRDGDHRINSKINANGKQDVVTDADNAIQDFTTRLFDGLLPVFGEESFKNDFSITYEPLYVVIDPIDGTREFARGEDNWSISLCAVENGKPVVASLFMPDKNELYTATVGSGVYLNGIPFRNPHELPETNKTAISPRQAVNPEFSQLILDSGLSAVCIPALTPKICALLRGDVDSSVYFPQLGQSASLWDYAASVLLVQEIGGRMTSLCGNDLPFSGSDIIHKRGWLATRSNDSHSRLLTCLGNSGQL